MLGTKTVSRRWRPSWRLVFVHLVGAICLARPVLGAGAGGDGASKAAVVQPLETPATPAAGAEATPVSVAPTTSAEAVSVPVAPTTSAEAVSVPVAPTTSAEAVSVPSPAGPAIAPAWVPSAEGETQAAPAPQPVYRRWWFWAGAAGLVAAGVITTVLLTRSGQETPSTQLGDMTAFRKP